jgi:hypothetical protein
MPVADLNGDGHLDIVTADYKGHVISVLLNTTTSVPTPSFLATCPRSSAPSQCPSCRSWSARCPPVHEGRGSAHSASSSRLSLRRR